MAGVNSAAMANVLILDMSTLTLTRDTRCGLVQVSTACGEVVGETTVRRTTKPAAAAFAAFEAALATGRVARASADGTNVYHSIALLNPHTGQISTGPAGHTPVLNLPAGTHIGDTGALGQLHVSPHETTLTIMSPQRATCETTPAGKLFDLAAVRAAHAPDRCAIPAGLHRACA